MVGKDWNAHTRLSYSHAPILPFLPCTYTFLLSHHKASRRSLIVFTRSVGTAQYSGRNLSTVQFRTCYKSIQPEFVSLEFQCPSFTMSLLCGQKSSPCGTIFFSIEELQKCSQSIPQLPPRWARWTKFPLPSRCAVHQDRKRAYSISAFSIQRHLGTLCILSPESEPGHPLLLPNLFSQVPLSFPLTLPWCCFTSNHHSPFHPPLQGLCVLFPSQPHSASGQGDTCNVMFVRAPCVPGVTESCCWSVYFLNKQCNPQAPNICITSKLFLKRTAISKYVIATTERSLLITAKYIFYLRWVTHLLQLRRVAIKPLPLGFIITLTVVIPPGFSRRPSMQYRQHLAREQTAPGKAAFSSALPRNDVLGKMCSANIISPVLPA